MSSPGSVNGGVSRISPEAIQEKKSAASSSVIAAVGLTSIKLVIGLLTGSLGILSEAAHSGLDLVAAGMTLLAVRVSDRPADKGHAYGHGKVENLSALFETLLLLITCVWIVYEAVRRIFFTQVQIEVNVWSFLVMGTSIVVDITRSRILRRAAIKHNSQALEADALHFSTDIWSSSVVIVGLALVWLGRPGGTTSIQRAIQSVIPTVVLEKADVVAALGVAAIVVWISLQLGKRTVSVLMDTAPSGATEKVRRIAAGVPGVLEITQLRVRPAGADTFIDMNIAVPRTATFEEAHRIATEIESRVRNAVPRSDAVVHINPMARPDETAPETVRAVAARFGLGVHSLHVHKIGSRLDLELHVEVPAEIMLSDAHRLASDLESDLRAELGPQTRVRSHLEPAVGGPPAARMSAADSERIRVAVQQIAQDRVGTERCHDVLVREEGGMVSISMHCWVDGATPIAAAHALTSELETLVRQRIPNVGQVLIHLEPAGQTD